MWEVLTTAEYDAWEQSLGDVERGQVTRKLNLLRRDGPKLSRPHADTLNGSRHANMKELRASGGKSVLRNAYALDPERVAILLTAGDKSGVASRRFYKVLVAKADALFDEHLRRRKTRKASQ